MTGIRKEMHKDTILCGWLQWHLMREIHRIGILGAGTLGRLVGKYMGEKGLNVYITDTSDQALESAGRFIRDYAHLCESGGFDEQLPDCDLVIECTPEVPDAKMVKISGTFLTKVFEGHYKNMGRWVKEMKAYVKSKNKEIKQFYFFYTTCPKCAKYYGKNYIVILAEI